MIYLPSFSIKGTNQIKFHKKTIVFLDLNKILSYENIIVKLTFIFTLSLKMMMMLVKYTELLPTEGCN